MSLLERIKEAQVKARLDKNKSAAGALTVFLGELNRKDKKLTSDEDVTKALLTYTSGIRKQFGAMPYLKTEEATNELALLESFLPKRLTPEEIADIMGREKFETLSMAMKWFSMYEIKHGVIVDKTIVREMFVH
jgi:uncharacterized protein YqeY